MPHIDVNLPGAEYRITVAPGILGDLGAIVRGVAPHEHAMIVVDERIARDHGAHARRSLEAAGYRVATVGMEAVESKKTLATVERLLAAFADARVERRTPVVAVGGGLTGDVAGFAAATWLRGVPVVQVPTTLLAMVDASIGGKTGVNFPLPGSTTLGKNLVGAFWQPKAVVADPLVLRTLDPRDLRCGRAESIKHAVLADADFFDALLADPDGADPDAQAQLIARSASIKAVIVRDDEREAGRRALLNLGHTFAHAVEPRPELDLRHGEAVAIGLCAAARCAEGTGRLDAATADRIVAGVAALGLPTRLRTAAPVNELIDAMAFDKKVVDGRLRLILPTRIGAAEIVDDVPRRAVIDAWAAVAPDGA